MENHVMKARWKILIALGILLVLMAASLLVTLHVQPANELEAYKKLLRDKGEKLDLSEVQPPPVAPEDNSVDAVEEAFRMFGSGEQDIPNAMTMVAPGKAMIGWIQPDARGYDFTNSWDEFGAEIEVNRPAIELLQQVLERSKLAFQLDYKKGAPLLLPHLAPMKRAAQKLDAAAIYELHNGDSGAAATNILTILALVHNNASEGLLISHLFRTALTSIAVAPTWELLQTTNVTDAQLAAVQRGWQQMNFLKDAENTFTMERVWMMREIMESRASHEGFKRITGWAASMGGSGSSSSVWEDLTEDPRSGVGEAMWRSSWSFSAELQMLKSQQMTLETLRTMQTNQSGCYKADYDAMVSRLSPFPLTHAGQAFFSALKIPDPSSEFGDVSFGGVLLKMLRIETARDVVITAIALKRFQMKHGQWPATLNELAPEFMPSVPIDPYDGKPLKYHPNSDGTFLLYSVGEDGVDDGGDPTNIASGNSSLYWQNPKARDWVWPQPASPAEVRNFYENPPK